MLRKSLLKASFPHQVELNPVKDSDIIKMYQKHLKEATEKQRRILEIQLRAARKESTTQEKPSPRVSRPYFPPIITDFKNNTNRTQKIQKERIKDSTNSNQNPFQLPRISKHINKGTRGDRDPVFDPRFSSLLSSLIAIPKPYGQIQRYAPPRRLTYASVQK